jgi:hypothetical protein
MRNSDVFSARDSEVDGDEDRVFRIGLVQGLNMRADLNGRLARAVRWVSSKSRWALVMDGGEKVLVKDENIDFQAEEAIAAESMQVHALASLQPTQTQTAHVFAL